jgi:hypothetical protein
MAMTIIKKTRNILLDNRATSQLTVPKEGVRMAVKTNRKINMIGRKTRKDMRCRDKSNLSVTRLVEAARAEIKAAIIYLSVRN